MSQGPNRSDFRRSSPLSSHYRSQRLANIKIPWVPTHSPPQTSIELEKFSKKQRRVVIRREQAFFIGQPPFTPKNHRHRRFYRRRVRAGDAKGIMIQGSRYFSLKTRDSSFAIIAEVATVSGLLAGCSFFRIADTGQSVPPVNTTPANGGNKRVSLRGVTSWHIRLYFTRARYYLRDAGALSLSVGRTRVLQPWQITNNQQPERGPVSFSLFHDASSSPSALSPLRTSPLPRGQGWNVSIHFSSGVTIRVTDLLTVPYVYA